jgi:hypothetical protein
LARRSANSGDIPNALEVAPANYLSFAMEPVVEVTPSAVGRQKGRDPARYRFSRARCSLRNFATLGAITIWQ